MTAIITNNLRKSLLTQLIQNILGDSDNYYVGIGRSEAWNDSDVAPAASGAEYYEREFRDSLQAIKASEEVSLIIARNNWSAGTIYSAFDDIQNGPTDEPYYVVTESNNVYICIQRGKNSDGTNKVSVSEPTGTGTSVIDTGDGYKWLFLYQISTQSGIKWLSANYMPVQVIDSAADIIEQLQLDAQNASVAGEIVNIVVTNGGSGYTSAPTVTITGDGDSAATAVATISGSQVTKIEMTDYGSGFTRAKVSITGGGGSNATARAVISKNGLAKNPTDTLRSTALMFNIKTSGTELGNFIVGNDFRQVGILKNPTDYSDTKITSTSASALKTMEVASTVGFDLDEEITGNPSGSKAIIDYIDGNTIYYHQTISTGYGSFNTDVTLDGPSISGISITNVIDSAACDAYSGDLIYLENRSPILRSASQDEDIKLIIQL